MLAIRNAELVLHDHYLPDATLLIGEGKILSFGESREISVPAGCEVIDAQGLYLAPGMIDIHTHASGEHPFTENPVAGAQNALLHGTTTVLPTLYFKMNQREYLDAIELVKDAMRRPEGANIGGIYMEGPYLNPKFGANRLNNPWRGPISAAEYQPLIEHCGSAVRVWALAPERENIVQFVRDAKKANPSVRFAVAHSEATPAQVEALIPYGLCIGTHHTNATGTLVKYPECRGVCVDETVNYNREIYAELICDSHGIHVDPYMQRLVRRIKGDDRIILISDADTFPGPTPPGYEGVTDIGFDMEGEISGSKMTLEVACRNMMKHTGASLVDVFNFASYNPARAVGFSDRGEIAVGKRADLVIVDHKANVKTVILNGKVQ